MPKTGGSAARTVPLNTAEATFVNVSTRLVALLGRQTAM